jgi:hypothetical protein
MQRGRSWYALQVFSITQSRDPGLRVCAFRVFAGPMILAVDLQTDAMLTVVKGGLEDSQSIDVSGPSMFFFCSYLTIVRSIYCYQNRLSLVHLSLPPIYTHPPAQSLSLLYPMLDTLPFRILIAGIHINANTHRTNQPISLPISPPAPRFPPSAHPPQHPIPTVTKPFHERGSFTFPPLAGDPRPQRAGMMRRRMGGPKTRRRKM